MKKFVYLGALGSVPAEFIRGKLQSIPRKRVEIFDGGHSGSLLGVEQGLERRSLGRPEAIFKG